ncbi:MAG: HAMP domain-containing histidine kinase, partial [Candidatus Omnitrophica bacterium]|nr:HAMP domain-containing histidine kinase [Candidatus Omnitrophota bacterium]
MKLIRVIYMKTLNKQRRFTYDVLDGGLRNIKIFNSIFRLKRMDVCLSSIENDGGTEIKLPKKVISNIHSLLTGNFRSCSENILVGEFILTMDMAMLDEIGLDGYIVVKDKEFGESIQTIWVDDILGDIEGFTELFLINIKPLMYFFKKMFRSRYYIMYKLIKQTTGEDIVKIYEELSEIYGSELGFIYLMQEIKENIWSMFSDSEMTIEDCMIWAEILVEGLRFLGIDYIGLYSWYESYLLAPNDEIQNMILEVLTKTRVTDGGVEIQNIEEKLNLASLLFRHLRHGMRRDAEQLFTIFLVNYGVLFDLYDLKWDLPFYSEIRDFYNSRIELALYGDKVYKQIGENHEFPKSIQSISELEERIEAMRELFIYFSKLQKDFYSQVREKLKEKPFTVIKEEDILIRDFTLAKMIDANGYRLDAIVEELEKDDYEFIKFVHLAAVNLVIGLRILEEVLGVLKGKQQNITNFTTFLNREVIPPFNQNGYKVIYNYSLPSEIEGFYANPYALSLTLEKIISNALWQTLKMNKGDEVIPIEIDIVGYIKAGYLIFKIRDYAGGVNPEFLKINEFGYQKLFEQSVGERTGIGMALTYMLVKSMGGFIEADNNKDIRDGAIFTLQLPLLKEVFKKEGFENEVSRGNSMFNLSEDDSKVLAKMKNNSNTTIEIVTERDIEFKSDGSYDKADGGKELQISRQIAFSEENRGIDSCKFLIQERNVFGFENKDIFLKKEKYPRVVRIWIEIKKYAIEKYAAAENVDISMDSLIDAEIMQIIREGIKSLSSSRFAKTIGIDPASIGSVLTFIQGGYGLYDEVLKTIYFYADAINEEKDKMISIKTVYKMIACGKEVSLSQRGFHLILKNEGLIELGRKGNHYFLKKVDKKRMKEIWPDIGKSSVSLQEKILEFEVVAKSKFKDLDKDESSNTERVIYFIIRQLITDKKNMENVLDNLMPHVIGFDKTRTFKYATRYLSEDIKNTLFIPSVGSMESGMFIINDIKRIQHLIAGLKYDVKAVLGKGEPCIENLINIVFLILWINTYKAKKITTYKDLAPLLMREILIELKCSAELVRISDDKWAVLVIDKRKGGNGEERAFICNIEAKNRVFKELQWESSVKNIDVRNSICHIETFNKQEIVLSDGGVVGDKNEILKESIKIGNNRKGNDFKTVEADGGLLQNNIYDFLNLTSEDVLVFQRLSPYMTKEQILLLGAI